jgi:cyclic beta-1,2-glucan synthetase
MFILRIFGRVQPQLPWNNRESIREELFSVERLEEHEKRLAIAQPVVSGRFRGSPLAGRLVASCVGPLKDHARAGIFDVDQRRRPSAIIEWIRICGTDRPAHKDVAKYGTSCGLFALTFDDHI